MKNVVIESLYTIIKLVSPIDPAQAHKLLRNAPSVTCQKVILSGTIKEGDHKKQTNKNKFKSANEVSRIYVRVMYKNDL